MNTGCSKTDLSNLNHKVCIKNTNGSYKIYRNGKPFIIKGAGGFQNLDVLAAAGGNAIRIWDTTNIEGILQQAQRYNIAVIVGIPMPESNDLVHYNNVSEINNQFDLIRNFVKKHKNNPAILMWCVGNELGFPLGFSHESFYNHFNKIVKMIHNEDPDHPVTTTLKNFENKAIINIKIRTDIDVISFNTFGRLSYLREDLKKFSWLWNGPYIVTEWGIDGPWEGTAQTAWGAYIEPSSHDKSTIYLSRYKNSMPVEDPRFLGSFIFYWGQKQETTHTWFSLFNENGKQNEVVDAAKYIWTGKRDIKELPGIKEIKINGRSVSDNIIEKANTSALAEIELLNQSADVPKIHWEIYPEDWYKKNKKDNDKKPLPVKGVNISATDRRVTFLLPEKEGPYRLFATIDHNNGNISTCNIPFYVVKSK